jgi:hypothetical protein
VSRRFVVIYEARADFDQATELADRVLVDSAEWLGDWLDANRLWIGDHISGGFLTWKSIPSRARELGIAVHGHFDGEPGQPDAQAARRAETPLSTLEARGKRNGLAQYMQEVRDVLLRLITL